MTPRRRWALWLAALAVTGYLAATIEPATAPASFADAVEPAGGRADAERGRARGGADVEILPLRPRTVSAETRALFASTSWAPPPPAAKPPPPPPPPTAPALPFKYVGKQWTGELWEVFVSRGEQTLVLREKQTIEAAYRIDSIKPPKMVLTYLPLDEQQTMDIGTGE